MRDIANQALLGDADVDWLASVVGNLLQEVVALPERVAELEGETDPPALRNASTNWSEGCWRRLPRRKA